MTRISLQEATVFSVLNVRSLFPEFLPSVFIREFTLEKSLIHAGIVGNCLLGTLVLCIIKKFTQEKGLMYAVNVGSLLRVLLLSVFIREFTLEKGLMSAVNVGNFFHGGLRF